MKRARTAAALLIVTALICSATLHRFHSVAEELISQAKVTEQALRSGDVQAAEGALEQLGGLWRRERDFFHLLSGRESCELLEESLGQVKVWLSQKEKSPEALSELSRLILNIQWLLRSQLPAVTNLL